MRKGQEESLGDWMFPMRVGWLQVLRGLQLAVQWIYAVCAALKVIGGFASATGE
jgi:hypothetical protein